MIIVVIVLSNIAGDLGGSVHHPVFGWVVIVVILVAIARIMGRRRR
jgi:hypothetical protein